MERADIRFGKEFTTAVEQKQIAQQDAERAKFVVEKAEQERQAAVIRAEGEAEAANTISKALNRAGDAFVQFRKIEAAREIGMFFLFLFSSILLPSSYCSISCLSFILTSCSITIVLQSSAILPLYAAITLLSSTIELN